MTHKTPVDAARERHPASTAGGPWLSPNDAAEYLGFKRTTIYKLMGDREIAYRSVNGRRRIAVAELDRYVKRRNRRAAS